MDRFVQIRMTIELAEQLRDWSEPVQVRFVDRPEPMLEFRTLKGGTLPESVSMRPIVSSVSQSSTSRRR
jgi:hypothetical protein